MKMATNNATKPKSKISQDFGDYGVTWMMNEMETKEIDAPAALVSFRKHLSEKPTNSAFFRNLFVGGWVAGETLGGKQCNFGCKMIYALSTSEIHIQRHVLSQKPGAVLSAHEVNIRRNQAVQQTQSLSGLWGQLPQTKKQVYSSLAVLIKLFFN